MISKGAEFVKDLAVRHCPAHNKGRLEQKVSRGEDLFTSYLDVKENMLPVKENDGVGKT